MSYPESPWSYTDFSFLAAIALGMGAIICVVSLAKEFVLVALALLVVVCFLLGSIPWGVIISKSVFHTDIREHGSGNIGTTNAMRTMGKKGGVAVFVLDFGKGLLSGLIALFVLATFIPGAGVAADSPVSASTVVALTLTPVLCSYLLNRKATGMKELREAWIARKLKVVYKRALELALAYQKWVLGTTIALFVVALVIFFHLGRSFLPPFNEGSFTINVSSLPGISLDESDQIGRRAEALLLQVPEIKTVARKTGRAELDEHALGVNVSEIEAPFELQDRSRDEVMNDVRKKLSTISGANIEIGQPISHRIDAMLSGTEANIAIKLFGTDLNLMFTVGNQIKAANDPGSGGLEGRAADRASAVDNHPET